MKECRLCHVEIPEQAWETHINGKKHVGKVQAAKKTLTVSGFQSGVVVADIVTYFKKFGKVNKVDLKADSNPVTATIILKTIEDATAVRAEKNHVLNGKKLRIQTPFIKTDRHKQAKVDRKIDRIQQEGSVDQFMKTSITVGLAYVGSLDDQIMNLPPVIGLSRDDEFQREQVRESLQAVFSVFIPDSRMKIIGSSVNGLGMKLSNLNLLLDINNPLHDDFRGNVPETPSDETARLSKLMSQAWQGMLSDRERCELAADMTLLDPASLCGLICHAVRRYVQGSVDVTSNPKARCPYVRFVHGPTGISCEITSKNGIAANVSNLIRLFVQMDQRVKPLIFAVRTWAKLFNLSGLNQSSKPSSYSWNLMVLFYLQNAMPRLLPSVQSLMDRADKPMVVNNCECGFLDDVTRIPPSSNFQFPGHLLYDFFDFYCNFNFANLAICPRSGEAVDKNWIAARSAFKSKPMSIQDPFILAQNVSQNVSEGVVAAMIKEFGRAKLLLCSPFYIERRPGLAPWGLTALFDSQVTIEEIQKTLLPRRSENGNPNYDGPRPGKRKRPKNKKHVKGPAV